MDYDSSRKYGSMVRAYSRFKQINTDAGSTISLHAARDAADDFFQHCYHLKDYIKKDPTFSHIDIDIDIETVVNDSPNLALAADYCNAGKHAGLDRDSRSGKIIERSNVHTKLDITPHGFVATSRLELIISGERYDAFELATACMEEWDQILVGKEGLALAPK